MFLHSTLCTNICCLFVCVCTFFRDWCLSRQLWWGHKVPAYRVQVQCINQSVFYINQLICIVIELPVDQSDGVVVMAALMVQLGVDLSLIMKIA